MNKNMLLPQNFPTLNENIRKWGCRFMCLISIPQLWLNKYFTDEDINDLYVKSVKLGSKVMKENCECGEEEHKIINLAFVKLGSKNTCSQIGKYENGELSFYDGSLITPEIDFIIDDYSTDYGKHFILSLPDRSISNNYYNPWSTLYDKKLTLNRLSRKLLYKVK